MGKKNRKQKAIEKADDVGYVWLLVWGGIGLLVLFSLRGYLLNEGQIGHNWDFTFPYLKPMMFKFVNESIYTWREINLGSPQLLNISRILHNFLIVVLGFVLGPVWAVKILMIGVILIGVWGMGENIKYQISNIKHKEVLGSYWWVPFAVLYGLSPFLFNEIIGGSWYMWISFAAIPWWVLFLVRLVREGVMNIYLLLFLLASMLVFGAPQNFVLIEGILFLYLVFEGLWLKRLGCYIRRFLILHAILALINSYWILPMVSTHFESGEGYFEKEFSSGFPQVKNTTQNLLRIFDLSGYLNRDMYFWAVPGWLRWGLVACGGVGMALVVRGMMLMGGGNTFISTKLRNHLRGAYVIWLGIFLITILVVKGASQPFGNWTMWFFNVFPLMNMYRSPQHLMLAPAFLVPVLLAYAYASIVNISDREGRGDRIDKNSFVWQNLSFLDPVRYREKLWYIMLGLVLVWTSGWWVNGDIGRQTLTDQKRDHVDFYRLPPGLEKYYEKNLSDEQIHRVLFLPSVFSPVYLPTEYQIVAQGGQPEYKFLRHHTLNAEVIDYAKWIDEYFCGLREFDWEKILGFINGSEVVVRGDVVPMFTSCRNSWDANQVLKKMEENENWTRAVRGPLTFSYDLDNKEYFLHKFYLPEKVVKVADELDKLPELVSDEEFDVNSAVLFSQDKKEVIEIGNLPKLSFKQISPVKYRVLIRGARERFYLVFSEYFDTKWKVYVTTLNGEMNEGRYVSPEVRSVKQNNNLISGSFWETWFKQPALSEEDHVRANGLMNAWAVNPKPVCGDNENCLNLDDGSYMMELVIEHEPQRYLYLGLLITALVWMGLLILILRKT